MTPQIFGEHKPRGTPADIEKKKEQFGMWLGLPKEAREQKNLEELAKFLDVNKLSLGKWKEDPIVIHTKENALRIFAGKHNWKVTDKLIELAEAGQVGPMRLYMEWQGMIGPVRKREESTEARKFEVTIVREDKTKGVPEAA